MDAATYLTNYFSSFIVSSEKENSFITTAGQCGNRKNRISHDLQNEIYQTPLHELASKSQKYPDLTLEQQPDLSTLSYPHAFPSSEILPATKSRPTPPLKLELKVSELPAVDLQCRSITKEVKKLLKHALRYEKNPIDKSLSYIEAIDTNACLLSSIHKFLTHRANINSLELLTSIGKAPRSFGKSPRSATDLSEGHQNIPPRWLIQHYFKKNDIIITCRDKDDTLQAIAVLSKYTRYNKQLLETCAYYELDRIANHPANIRLQKGPSQGTGAKGAGSKIIAYIAQKCLDSCDIAGIRLYSVPSAVTFYQKLGFRQYDLESESFDISESTDSSSTDSSESPVDPSSSDDSDDESSVNEFSTMELTREEIKRLFDDPNSRLSKALQ